MLRLSSDLAEKLSQQNQSDESISPLDFTKEIIIVMCLESELIFDKMKKKKEYYESERDQQSEIKQLQQTQEKTLKRLKTEYDGKIDTTINNYEQMLIKLREELELKIKVRVFLRVALIDLG